ncbi:hypothetical protein INR49_030986 [Caranx melampygus]|nr:hypothetical protein INR49_030986 [Caranx melampygus]
MKRSVTTFVLRRHISAVRHQQLHDLQKKKKKKKKKTKKKKKCACLLTQKRNKNQNPESCMTGSINWLLGEKQEQENFLISVIASQKGQLE